LIRRGHLIRIPQLNLEKKNDLLNMSQAVVRFEANAGPERDIIVENDFFVLIANVKCFRGRHSIDEKGR